MWCSAPAGVVYHGRSAMPIYVVVSTPPEALADAILDLNEADRYEVSPGTWFIRSPFVTTEQVKDSLGIQVDGPVGIVVAVGRYSGVAEREFIEKLQVWEEAE